MNEQAAAAITETFYEDKATGNPCPRLGNVLCTLSYDPSHRHVRVGR